MEVSVEIVHRSIVERRVSPVWCCAQSHIAFATPLVQRANLVTASAVLRGQLVGQTLCLRRCSQMFWLKRRDTQ